MANKVPIEGGQKCPKCLKQMQRFRHSAGDEPQNQQYYYRYWDRCIPCSHIQHYGDAMTKVVVKQQSLDL